MPSYLTVLQEASDPGAYLIIEVDGTDDFLQFTASPTSLELDLPLVSERQQSLEERFRAAALDLGLVVRDSRGSDGARFLDIDLEKTSAGPNTQEILVRLYGVDTEAKLIFVCHRCRSID